MFKQLITIICILGAVVATDVKKCTGNKPFPLEVRIKGCDIPPCILYKGTTVEFEIDFVSYKDISHMTTIARATTFGITVPYELPEDVKNVCANLMYGAYCPLYPTEDVTYLFVFPISNYPEVSARIEISILDQDNDVTTCFLCDIKIRKSRDDRNVTNIIYEIDF